MQGCKCALVSIFISHSRHDRYFIDPLEQGLGKLHIEPVLIESDTPISQTLQDAIREGIERSSAVFVIWTLQVTSRTDTLDNVKWEAAQAYALRKPLFVFKEINAPELPMIIQHAITYHTFDANIQSQVQEALDRAFEKAQEIYKQVSVLSQPGIILDIEQLASPKDTFFDSTSNPYRSFAITLKNVGAHVYDLNRDTYDWLSRNTPIYLSFGYLHPTQNGAAFRYDNTETRRDSEAGVTRDGFIYYGELIAGEDGIHIGRTIIVIGNMLRYAQQVYEHFSFYDAGDDTQVVIRFKVGNVRGQRLAHDLGPNRWPLHQDYIYEGNELIISKEHSLGEICQSRNSITESIIFEFCRSFGFLFDTEQVGRGYVESVLRQSD